MVATDHAPTAEEKSGSYFQAPSGGPLVQHALQRCSKWCTGVLPVQEVANLMAHRVADMFDMTDRRYIRTGHKADLVLVDPNDPWKVTSPTSCTNAAGRRLKAAPSNPHPRHLGQRRPGVQRRARLTDTATTPANASPSIDEMVRYIKHCSPPLRGVWNRCHLRRTTRRRHRARHVCTS